MSNKEYQELMEGLQEAIEHARGERVLTVREMPLPAEPKPMTARQIAHLRTKELHVSQAYFAKMLNVSPSAVQAWEQSIRSPGHGTLRLLWVLRRHPNLAATVASAC